MTCYFLQTILLSKFSATYSQRPSKSKKHNKSTNYLSCLQPLEAEKLVTPNRNHKHIDLFAFLIYKKSRLRVYIHASRVLACLHLLVSSEFLTTAEDYGNVIVMSFK